MPDSLIIGQISLSFHAAAAAVVAEGLSALGHSVKLCEAPHEAMFKLLEKGDVDLVCSAWLPASHGRYVASFEDRLTKLSVIYTPYCIWGIDASAPVGITSVGDLAQPDVAKMFNKRIQGINPGAGISRFSRKMVREYGLQEQGFHFENGTLEACTSAALNAISSGELAVVPLWHPQWLHTEIELRELRDPLGLLGGQDAATLVIRNEAMSKVNEKGLAFLNRISLGNHVVSKLDQMICRGGLPPREAAKRWLIENPGIL